MTQHRLKLETSSSDDIQDQIQAVPVTHQSFPPCQQLSDCVLSTKHPTHDIHLLVPNTITRSSNTDVQLLMIELAIKQ